jgi:hypothetical protein
LRKAHVFLILAAACSFLVLGLYVRSELEIIRSAPALRQQAELMRALRLTDLCLSTDARYTRNPSQADLFTPFQDYPASIEHFPTGSVIPPPDFSGLSTQISVKRR